MTYLNRLFFGVLLCFTSNAFATMSDLHSALAITPNRQALTADISTDGNTAVFSTIDIDNDQTPILIFEKHQGLWQKTAEILPPEIAFALSLQISGDGNTIAIPSFLANRKAGAVYIYTRNGQQWGLQAKITATDYVPNSREYFGSIVSLSYDGQTMLVTKRPEEPNGGQLPVYIFQRNNGAWVQQQKLLSTGNQDIFITATMSDDAKHIAVSTQDDKAVDIYTKQGNTWTRTQQIIADSGFPNQELFLTLSNQHLLINVANSSEDEDAENIIDAFATSAKTTIYEWQNSTFANPKDFDGSFGWGAIRDNLLALPTKEGLAIYQQRTNNWQRTDIIEDCKAPTCLSVLPIITPEKQIIFSKLMAFGTEEDFEQSETAIATPLKGGNITTPKLLANATNSPQPVPTVNSITLLLLITLSLYVGCFFLVTYTVKKRA